MREHLIPLIVGKGLLRHGAAMLGVANLRHVACAVVLDGRDIAVFIRHGHRHIEAVIHLFHAMSETVGLFDHIEITVVGVGLDVAVFVLVANELTVRIEGARARVAVSVGDGSYAARVVREAGGRRAYGVLLTYHATVIVVGVFKVAYVFSIGAV